MRLSARFFLSVSILVLSTAVAFSQQKANSNPDKPAPAPVPLSYRAPKFSDDDRKKMAEIEQRPEIKAAIEDAWAARRKADMDYVYLLNSTSHFTETTGPEYTTFVSHNGQLYNNPMLQRYI